MSGHATPALQRIRLAEINADRRLRPVSEAGVETILASVAEIGRIKDPIHLRRSKRGLTLLAGAHRLEAHRRLGAEEVDAWVWSGITDDHALLIEIDDNLAGAEMNALDTAVFLATRKVVYERLHPETRAGAFKGNRHTGSLAADMMSVASFATTTAEKFGLTDRHVRRMIAAGSKLVPDQVRALRQAPRPVSLKDLTDIAKIVEPADRYSVVERLAAGHAKSAADALRSLRVEKGVKAPPKSPEDQQLLALLSAWSRAGRAVRRRFVEETFADLSALVVDEAEGRGAADLAALRRGLAAK